MSTSDDRPRAGTLRVDGTETCADVLPPLITDVEPTPGGLEKQQATRPAGHMIINRTPAVDKRTYQVIMIKFLRRALQAARQREWAEAFTAAYAKRAGIEWTLSRGIRTRRLRQTCSIGLEKTRLGHRLAAAALR